MKDNRGFAMVLLMALLPIILAAGIFSFLLYSFLRGDLATLNSCRRQQLDIQDKAGEKMQSLLDLNPQAADLRAQEIAARQALTAATESLWPPAIAAAEARLLKVQMARKKLGQQQTDLIHEANQTLQEGGFQLKNQVQKIWDQQQNKMRPWWTAELRLRSAKIPHLSVKPDMPDAAPIYEPVPDFEEAQSWVQNWQVTLQTKTWTKKFLPVHVHFDRTCATSLYAKDDSWIAHLKKAKF